MWDWQSDQPDEAQPEHVEMGGLIDPEGFQIASVGLDGVRITPKAQRLLIGAAVLFAVYTLARGR